MKNCLRLLTFISLFGCGTKIPKNNNSDEPGAKTNKIIFLTDYFTSYIKAVKTDFPGRNEIYKKKIAQPVLKNYFQNCEYLDLATEQLSSSIQDTSELEHIISVIDLNRTTIEKKILAVLLKCNIELKNESLTIYILPATKDSKEILKEMNGVNGLTAGSKKIIMTINPEMEGWQAMLEYAIAHEFHHAFWTSNNFNKLNKCSLLEYLVFEGKADSYAHSLYPTIKAQWTCSLNDSEQSNLWLKIKPQLQSENFSFQREVMFGSKEYPIWGGYTIGYSIVQTALKNNKNLNALNWTNLTAENILKLSSFK